MTLKLEVGKRYRTRSGRVATVASCGAQAIVVHANGWHYLHDLDGRHASRERADYDLISEIEEPKKETPMVKMVVRDEKREPEITIEWWLEPCEGPDGGLWLRARKEGTEGYQTVARITGSGTLRLTPNVYLPGVVTADYGRIKVID